ncbi:MAG: flavodoxin family protein [Acidimicrobiia bacterium]
MAGRHLLVVFHSATGGADRMAERVIAGASDDSIEGVEVRVVRALDAGVDDVLWSDAIVLGTPENFGYMSGALKHFFDTIYYPCLDRTRGRPYALFVRAGHDGAGAVLAVSRIATGLGWREVQAPVVAVGAMTTGHLDACTELGGAMAAGLAMDLF